MVSAQSRQMEVQLKSYIKKILERKGFDRLSSIIFAELWLEPKEISMEELADRVGYSLSSISLKMKELRRFWFLKIFKKKGSRKTYIYLEKNILKAALEKIKRDYEWEDALFREKITPLVKEYKKKAKSKEEKAKLRILENSIKNHKAVKRIVNYISKCIGG
ncbi:hypothetical protein DRN74_01280 [Candidatus Micrarchaeota archaeon]|nr:MAG: hypothetical protein DRN74_01280 [Candidatus Micrarchaeota archaeon]